MKTNFGYFQILTGTLLDYSGTSAPTGWLLCDGKTIGNASSGATGRANADTQDLFLLLWNSLADSEAPVSGGRGASAAADFAANKNIGLPDMRGRITIGRDDMGGTAASRVTLAGSGLDATVLGKAGGSLGHALTAAQMPTHKHSASLGNPTNSLSHTHSYRTQEGGGNATATYWTFIGDNPANSTQTTSTSSPSLAHTHTINITSEGGDQKHNNVQPGIVLNKMVKL